ncbi:serine/threonine protein kinase [Lachnobacterium bovis]|uniref:serine/threonine protein kinase n=1 Tax=Lachnobacterium bovis TaxID=140626 RepID=UPI0003B628D4|nr:protein kinase [Lachnobacterium bovis]
MNNNSMDISIFSSNIIQKYEIIKQIGTGSFSFVFLAKHKTLDSLRAIKVISKEKNSYQSIISEALILKSLRHPGIPIIYDVEEDQNNVYLIQEYVSGLTLGEFLYNNKHISPLFFINLCEKLSDIYTFLHNSYETPLFYQDLKPEHIYIQDDSLKLIDFGNFDTIYPDNASTIKGNYEFSSPELLNGEKITIRSDVYTLAKLIKYVMNYLEFTFSKSSISALNKALSLDPKCRFETVDRFISIFLKDIQDLRSYNNTQQYSKIAILGTLSGCGCTHFSIAITSFFYTQQIPAVYIEKNNSNHLLDFQKANSNVNEIDGYLKYKNFNGLPNYGDGIIVKNSQNQIQIHDIGVLNDLTQLRNNDYDLFLIVLPSSEWLFESNILAIEKYLSVISKENVVLIANLSTLSISRSKHLIAISKHYNLPIYSFSYDTNPFIYSSKKDKIFRQILHLEGRKRRFLDFTNIFKHRQQ